MNKFFIVIRIVASALLFWALANHPYDYYTILRWVVCGVAAFSTYVSYEINKKEWTWIFGIIALLFNPIITTHLSREMWAYIDIITGIIFLLSIKFIKK